MNKTKATVLGLFLALCATACRHEPAPVDVTQTVDVPATKPSEDEGYKSIFEDDDEFELDLDF